MSDYIFGTSLSYRDYLQARSFEDALRSDISKQTRAIIASNSELQRYNISVADALPATISEGFEQLSTAVAEGFEQLSYGFGWISRGIDNLTAEIGELKALVQWGFSELLTATSRVNDALVELIKIAKTPAQTWAYEQFEIARDAFRKDLHDDAVEYLERAINGYASNTGYRLEYRFHYLFGVIRLGSFKNNSRDIVDPAKAEQAFLNAAKYARRDAPREAGRAYLAAGWAAYCQGKMVEAHQHTENAVALVADLAESPFQLSKITAHQRNFADALSPLEKAIRLDRVYALKAASDDDFKACTAEVRALIEKLRVEAKAEANKLLAQVREEVERLTQIHETGRGIIDQTVLRIGESALEEATDAAAKDTYFGYLDAAEICRRGEKNLREAEAESRRRHGEREEQKRRSGAEKERQVALERERHVKEIESQISIERNAPMAATWWFLRVAGLIASIILACTQCSRVYQANDRQEEIRKAAVQRMFGEIRAKGYDPDRLSVEEARRLGYRAEALPPPNIGITFIGAWFKYLALGIVASFLIAFVGNEFTKSARVAALERKRDEIKRGTR